MLPTLLIVALLVQSPSQRPSPGLGEGGQPQQTQSNSANQPANPDQRGTEKLPLVIKQVPTPKTNVEAAEEAKDREEKAANDRKLVEFTGRLVLATAVLAIIGFFQLIVFGLQARRLRQTVEAGAEQSRAMERSIAEANRLASAMENVAKDIAVSSKAAAESVIAVRERTAQQMRAYLCVIVGSGTFQDRANNLKFVASPTLINCGHTPAYKVSYKAKAAILPVPLPDEAVGGSVLGPQQNATLHGIVDDFCADEEVEDIKVGAQGKVLYIWGIVNYKDVFGESHFTKFCQTVNFIRIGAENKVTGFYIARHDEAN